MRKPVAVAILETQYQNLGDVLICESLVQRLCKHCTTYLWVQGLPPTFISRLQQAGGTIIPPAAGGIAAHVTVLADLVRSLTERRLFAFFPPGHIMASRNLRSVLRHVKLQILIAFLRALGVRVARLGVTVDVMKPHRWLSMLLLLNAEFSGMRDRQCLLAARGSGFRSVGFFPDLYLARLTSLPIGAARSPRPLAILCLRGQCQGSELDTPYASAVEACSLGILDSFFAANPDGLALYVYQVTADSDFTEKLATAATRLLGTRRIALANRPLQLRHAAEIYGDASIILTNRLHCALIACEVGSRVAFITDCTIHRKAINILSELNRKVEVVDIASRNGNNLSIFSAANLREKAYSEFQKDRRVAHKLAELSLMRLFDRDVNGVY